MDDSPTYIGILLFLLFIIIEFLFSYTIWESIPVTVNNRKYLWYSFSQKWHFIWNICVLFFSRAKKIGNNVRSSDPCSNFPTEIRIHILAFIYGHRRSTWILTLIRRKLTGWLNTFTFELQAQNINIQIEIMKLCPKMKYIETLKERKLSRNGSSWWVETLEK